MVGPRVLLSTLRHLRQRQIRYQVQRRFWRPAPRPFPLAWMPLAPRLPRAKNTSRIACDGRGGFRFNNVDTLFTGNWNPPGMRKLWTYNLHYMAWIFDLEPEGRGEWITRWIKENPRAGGGNGWEPYPVSLRLFNWCKHYALSGTLPSAEARESLSHQAGWLAANLEFHIDGNHLLENLLALQFAAFHLDLSHPRGASLESRIARLLGRELEDQFLADGGHYELSPMYHAILLERMLDLLNVWPEGNASREGLRGLIERKARAALDWLETMSVGGRFALFNDACYDAAPDASALLDFGARLLGRTPVGRIPLRSLAATGYHRAEAGPFTVIFDAGRLGPDHQMGHAQGDMLSFCLWLRDIPVLVHPGNYEYLPGAMREYCRSTASHNTLVPEGCEQAEWWSSHRVGRRGYSLSIETADRRGKVTLAASHDGFRRVSGGPVHRRVLEVTSAEVAVHDELEGTGKGASRAWFHLHPSCQVEERTGGIFVRAASGDLRFASDLSPRIVEGWHCPEFGLRQANRALVLESSSPSFRCAFRAAGDAGVTASAPGSP